MLKLTAYNQDVQRYLQGRKSTGVRKTTIIDIIQDSVLAAGKSFEKLFPNKSKRKSVMDEIIFYLSGCGICKVSAERLAKNTGASIRTVYDAVKNLKETGEILVFGLADGKNKYVFVFKSHPNFKEILKEVFFIDKLPVESEPEQPEVPVDPQPEPEQPKIPIEEPVKEISIEDQSENNQIADQNAVQIAELKYSENVEGVRSDGQKTSSNHINFFNLKQDNYIYKALESEIIKDSTKVQTETEYINTYYTNHFQFELYNHIKTYIYHQQIKENAVVIGLRMGSNANQKSFILAIKVLSKINRFLENDGTINTTVAALFSYIYRQLLLNPTRKKVNKPILKPCNKELPFFDWLNQELSLNHPDLKVDTDLEPINHEELNELGIY